MARMRQTAAHTRSVKLRSPRLSLLADAASSALTTTHNCLLGRVCGVSSHGDWVSAVQLHSLPVCSFSSSPVLCKATRTVERDTNQFPRAGAGSSLQVLSSNCKTHEAGKMHPHLRSKFSAHGRTRQLAQGPRSADGITGLCCLTLMFLCSSSC